MGELLCLKDEVFLEPFLRGIFLFFNDWCGPFWLFVERLDNVKNLLEKNYGMVLASFDVN